VKRNILTIVVLLGIAGLLVGFAMPEYRQGESSLAGTTAKDFEFILDGKLTHLSDLRGKVVVLNFWATWCPPCVEETPSLNSLQAQIAQQGGVTFHDPQIAQEKKDCLDSEQAIRDELVQKWSGFNATDKIACTNESRMGGDSSYTELLTCLEMARDVRNLRTEADAPDEVIESTVTKYLEENAAELAAEKDQPFHPIGMTHGDAEAETAEVETTEVGPEIVSAAADASADVASSGVAKSTAASSGRPAATVTVKARKPAVPIHVERRDSTLQKISKLDIRGRISLAMRGSKEDRSILVRDSTKLVAIAVLESPKISDGEVEGFALQKNVLESVLRAIPMKRRFAKNYLIIRNLVFNPRTPLDLSLGLMKNLLIHDLKNLSDNKEVPDTIRKLALRMFKQKMEKKN